MLMAREFCMMRRSVGFEAGSAPPAFTAMLMSLAMRAKPLAMRFQRANMACLRTSKMRPMTTPASAATPAGSGSCHCRRTRAPVSGRPDAHPIGALAAVDGKMRAMGVTDDLAPIGRQEMILRVVQRSPVVRTGVDVDTGASAAAYHEQPIVAVDRQEAPC